MERRIKLTEEQRRKLWQIKDGCKFKSLRDNEKLGDYFVVTTCNNDLIVFDTIKEAKEFNDIVKNTFDTEFFPTD